MLPVDEILSLHAWIYLGVELHRKYQARVYEEIQYTKELPVIGRI